MAANDNYYLQAWDQIDEVWERVTWGLHGGPLDTLQFSKALQALEERDDRKRDVRNRVANDEHVRYVDYRVVDDDGNIIDYAPAVVPYES